MTKDYQRTAIDTSPLAVPERVSIAMAEIAEDMREGLLALAVGAGLQVMGELMAADVAALCGPRGRHDPQRSATRHGSGRGSVTLGGRRVPVTRPRVRAADGSGELPVPAYELFTGTEVLGRMAMERMLAGLSARRYGVGLEPVGEQVSEAATATSKSAVSRKFVAMTEHALADLLSADLSQLDLVALMVDGVSFAEHLCVVALGIDIDGTKHPLVVVEGSTENTTLVRGLLVGLRERGLDVTKPSSRSWTAPRRCAPRCSRCSTTRCSPAASRTRSATCGITCPSGYAARSNGGCGRPTTHRPRWMPRPGWRRWPPSWARPTRVRRPACARAWTRR